MRFPGAVFALVSACALLAACDSRTRQGPVAPSASIPPNTPTPLLSLNIAPSNWTGDATVVDVRGPGPRCGWGIVLGQTRTAVRWRITINDAAISLEQDMDNWPTDHIPYSGTLAGREFTASYFQGEDYLGYVCQWKGGTIEGSFSEDFSSFEAFETVEWGPPENMTRVHRRWIGSRTATPHTSSREVTGS